MMLVVSSCPCLLLRELNRVTCQGCMCFHQLSCCQAPKTPQPTSEDCYYTFLSATLQLSTFVFLDFYFFFYPILQPYNIMFL